MSIKNNVVTSILSSNNKGVGKTDSLPGFYHFNENGDKFVIAGIGEANVNENLIGAKFVQLFHSFIKDMDDSKKLAHLNALSAGCITIDQHKGTTKGESSSGIVANKVQSAENYRDNCVKLALDKSNFDAVKAFALTSYDDKTSKTVLLSVIHDLQHLFFSLEDREHYENIKFNEEQTAKQFEKLVDLGFKDIVKGAKSITAILPFELARTSIPELVALGYTLLKKPVPDMTTYMTTVEFVEGKEELI